MTTNDYNLENLLALHGERIVIDESLGLWVKFEVTRTLKRSQGIKYSLTLHNRFNQRIMGFDNSHEIEYGAKPGIKAKRTFDHWHKSEKDKGRPYLYTDACQLLKDFWNEVDQCVQALLKEHR